MLVILFPFIFSRSFSSSFSVWLFLFTLCLSLSFWDLCITGTVSRLSIMQWVFQFHKVIYGEKQTFTSNYYSFNYFHWCDTIIDCCIQVLNVPCACQICKFVNRWIGFGFCFSPLTNRICFVCMNSLAICSSFFISPTIGYYDDELIWINFPIFFFSSRWMYRWIVLLWDTLMVCH